MNEPAPPTVSRSERSARFFNHVHRYQHLMRKHWWILPLGLLAGLAVQGYRLWQAPPAFASVGRMIVGIKINPQLGVGYLEEMSQFLGTQAALMKSDTVRKKAFDRVRALKPDLPPTPVDLQITVSPKTTIFNLQAVGGNAEFTRAYLDACMDEYILLKKDMRASTSDTTLAHLTEQIASLERDIKKFEDEEMSFKATNNVAAVQEQGNYAAKYLTDLNGQLAALKTELQLLTLLDLDQNLERRQKKGLPSVAAGNDPGDETTPLNLYNSDYFKAKQELLLRKAELQEWSEVLKPKHPRMIALNEDIRRRENLLAIFREQSQEQLEKRRESLALQIENLESAIKEWEVKSLEVSRKMAEYDRIRAGKKRLQDLYDRLLTTMQTIGVDKDISPESVTVLERASAARPAGANPALALGLGAALGLLAALAVLLLVDRLDDRPNSFTDLQELFDEPVLGQIPFEHNPNQRNGVLFIHADDDRHAFLEAYRSLRSSLLFMANERTPPRILLVTSAIPNDGKSMTAANLAITMALAGSRVLLVDADLRKGALHQHFKLEAAPGLHEVLSRPLDWRQAIRPTPTANLTLLPRGDATRNPGEMFLNPATPKLVGELAAAFDYVIIDSPPVMAADDVASVAPHVEGVLFVIRANCTSGRVARAALEVLYQRNVKVLGLVFNSVQPRSTDYYYYYHYKDYYAHAKGA
jgi:succinoglycan biosynthesis transport protein ExoP